MTEKKWCPRCKRYKHKYDFNRNKAANDGLSSYCARCMRQYALNRYNGQGISITRFENRTTYLDDGHPFYYCDTVRPDLVISDMIDVGSLRL